MSSSFFSLTVKAEEGKGKKGVGSAFSFWFLLLSFSSVQDNLCLLIPFLFPLPSFLSFSSGSRAKEATRPIGEGAEQPDREGEERSNETEK